MSFELDHIFICTSVGAPEADRLAAFGLTEGTPNEHPGQGTANRRFFFANAYLELLWVNDPVAAQSDLVQRTHLWQRWAGRKEGACPFGLGFRPTAKQEREVPFSSWEYRPPYLPTPLSISVGRNAAVVIEPMLFWLGFARRPDSRPLGERQPMEHASGVREITRLAFTSPGSGVSPELQAVVHSGLIQRCLGADYLLELGFDGEMLGRRMDFRPELPLVLCW
jgi:Glyoxalase-like domain